MKLVLLALFLAPAAVAGKGHAGHGRGKDSEGNPCRGYLHEIAEHANYEAFVEAARVVAIDGDEWENDEDATRGARGFSGGGCGGHGRKREAAATDVCIAVDADEAVVAEFLCASFDDVGDAKDAIVRAFAGDRMFPEVCIFSKDGSEFGRGPFADHGVAEGAQLYAIVRSMDGAWLADPAQSTWTPGSGPDVYGAEQIVKFFDGKIIFSDNPELVNGATPVWPDGAGAGGPYTVGADCSSLPHAVTSPEGKITFSLDAENQLVVDFDYQIPAKIVYVAARVVYGAGGAPPSKPPADEALAAETTVALADLLTCESMLVDAEARAATTEDAEASETKVATALVAGVLACVAGLSLLVGACLGMAAERARGAKSRTCVAEVVGDDSTKNPVKSPEVWE